MIPGRMGDQDTSLKVCLNSSTWFEPLKVENQTVAVLPDLMRAVMMGAVAPQFVFRVPLFEMVPTIVPQPVTVALVAMTSPFAKL